MKKTIIIANWKMNLKPSESLKLAEEIVEKENEWSEGKVEVILCPTFDSIASIGEVVKNSNKVSLGAQNCFWDDEGAFTGEVSPKVLKELGCKYVIVGHSERRQYLKETDEMVNKKVLSALKNNLIPIICVGETFEQRKEGRKDFVIMEQINKALADVKILSDDYLVIAYEPVWVIGSGQAVQAEEAEHTNRVIRQVLLDKLSLEIADKKTSITYGGSVNPENVNSFTSQPTVDGILVGGASLKPDTFIELVKQS